MIRQKTEVCLVMRAEDRSVSDDETEVYDETEDRSV